jgi:hypothetical protein
VPAVNFDFLDRRSAERFAELLDEQPTGGRRQHSHVPAGEQLGELVAIGHSLTAAKPGIKVDPEFRVGLRAMLVATAERDGIGRTAPAIASEPVVADHASDGRAGLRGLVLGRGGRRIRARGAIVIGVAAGAMAVSGISAASENASPGDALYGVKRSTERAQLAMAGSDITRGQLSLDFAKTRLAEAAAMSGNDAGFAGVLDDMDADTRKGVRLLDTSAVAHRDAKPLTTVDTFVAKQRQTLAPVLDKLSPANQERAAASLSLLDSVNRRTDDLRAGLNCASVLSAGSDSLGPKLKDCTTNADGPATARPSGHSGKITARDPRESKVKAERTSPAATPAATTDVDATTAPVTSTGPDLAPLGGTPVNSESPAPADDSDDNGGAPLGGLLGELFGIGS